MYVSIYMYIYYVVYVVCITGYGEGMGRVRVFGDGDYKIIPAPYPNGFSSYHSIFATIGENSGLSSASIWAGAGRVSIGYGEVAIPICVCSFSA